MLEIISALTPFFTWHSTWHIRLLGVALSMVIVPTLLDFGATAADVTTFMLLFVVYNNSYNGDTRRSFRL